MDEDDEYDASLLELEDAPVQRGSSCRLDVPPLAVLPPPPPQHQAGAGARYLRPDSLPLVPAATSAGDSWRAVAFDALPAVMTSAQSNNVPSVSAAPLPATNVPLAATALQRTHTVLDEDEEEDDIFRAVVVASLPSPDAPLPSLRSQPDLPLSSTPTPQRQTLHSSPVQQSVPYTLAEVPVRDAVGRASHSPAARRVHAPPPAAPASPATPATQGSTSSRAPTGVGDPFGSSWMGGSWYVACEALNLPADTWVSNTLGSEATCDMEACLLAQLCNIGAIVRCPRPALRGLPQLLVQVRSVEVHDSDAVAAVMDPTGSMLAFLSCRVLDECGPQLRVGSTLLLRGAAVFSPQAGIKYLNITPACVAAVWPAVGGPLPLAATQPAALVE